jgi:hypothetical protein
MKLARLFGLAVLLIGAFSLIFAQDDAAKPLEYVEVKKPFQNVYTKLDPKSDIVRQVRKGEYLELLSKGESWYKVKVDGKEGFLEAKAGKVVNKKGAPVVMFLLFIVVLLGGAAFVILYIKKQQVAASSPSLDDDDD